MPLITLEGDKGPPALFRRFFPDHFRFLGHRRFRQAAAYKNDPFARIIPAYDVRRPEKGRKKAPLFLDRFRRWTCAVWHVPGIKADEKKGAAILRTYMF